MGKIIIMRRLRVYEKMRKFVFNGYKGFNFWGFFPNNFLVDSVFLAG